MKRSEGPANPQGYPAGSKRCQRMPLTAAAAAALVGAVVAASCFWAAWATLSPHPRPLPISVAVGVCLVVVLFLSQLPAMIVGRNLIQRQWLIAANLFGCFGFLFALMVFFRENDDPLFSANLSQWLEGVPWLIAFVLGSWVTAEVAHRGAARRALRETRL